MFLFVAEIIHLSVILDRYRRLLLAAVTFSTDQHVCINVICLFRPAEMSWDFILPVCLGDLVKSGAVNQYVVQDVLSVKQLPSHINSKY